MQPLSCEQGPKREGVFSYKQLFFLQVDQLQSRCITWFRLPQGLLPASLLVCCGTRLCCLVGCGGNCSFLVNSFKESMLANTRLSRLQ